MRLSSGSLINRLGLVYNACGIYFLLRVFCQSLDDLITLCRICAILLVPLAVMMLFEKTTAYNFFSVLGGIIETPEIRGGKIRAQGPFAHSILAGTVGAVCLPLIIGLWKQHRRTAIVGIVACITMIIVSASSGPILSSLAAGGALLMWYGRNRMRLVRWLAVLGYIGIDLVMKAPAYYLIARIDITGSSTGWHRAFLIDTAIKHFSEWWLTGTDYTRHWIDYGVGWSEDHVDITNHFIAMGVYGGLLLMVLFIAILSLGFSYIGQMIRREASMPSGSEFMIRALGSALFAHAATFTSISYFDQTYVFFYLTLAAISTTHSETFAIDELEEAGTVKTVTK